MRKPDSVVTIHMAASLAGFIARKDGRVDWLETADEFAGEDTMDPEFVEALLKTIDCYVMGLRTYETSLGFEAEGLGWAYDDKPTVAARSAQSAFVAGCRRGSLLHPADIDRWRDPVLREARCRHRPASGRGQSLQERHGGALLRGAEDMKAKQHEELLSVLKARFEKKMNRHKGLEWQTYKKSLQAMLKVDSARCACGA